MVEGRARLLNRLPRRTTIPSPTSTRPVETGLVTLVLGDTGILRDGLADRLDGLVVAGFGTGHASAPVVPRLEALASRMPVVLASRTGASAVFGVAGG